MDFTNPRGTETDVDCSFPDRWSPRSFAPEPLTDGQVAALFEAARWAPSCYNDQPWFFSYARTVAGRNRFAAALVEANRGWAGSAPLLLFVAARRTFRKDDRPNRHGGFDAGAAWMSLALQARRLGLHAHAMAGFDPDRAYEVTGLNRQTYDILAAVAVGRRGDPSALPRDLQAMERPSGRHPLAEVAGEVVE